MSREVATFASLAAVVLVLGDQSQALMQHLLPNLVVFLSHAGGEYMLGSGRLRLVATVVMSTIIVIAHPGLSGISRIC